GVVFPAGGFLFAWGRVGDIRGVRGGVVDGVFLVVPDDLRVPRTRLELEPPAVLVRPEAAGRARDQRRAGLADDRARGEEGVREPDARGDPVRLFAGERVVDRLRERLRSGRLPAPCGRSGGEGAARGDEDDHGGEDDQARCRQGAEELHGRPFSSSCRAGCPTDSEAFLMSSIVKRAPSTVTLPPCRSTVARTIARP